MYPFIGYGSTDSREVKAKRTNQLPYQLVGCALVGYLYEVLVHIASQNDAFPFFFILFCFHFLLFPFNLVHGFTHTVFRISC